MGGSGEVAGLRVDVELEQDDEEPVRLRIEVAARVAGEIAEDRRRRTNHLRGEVEELVERGWPCDPRSIGAEDGQGSVDHFQDETISDAQALVRRLEAELRIGEPASTGEA